LGGVCGDGFWSGRNCAIWLVYARLMRLKQDRSTKAFARTEELSLKSSDVRCGCRVMRANFALLVALGLTACGQPSANSPPTSFWAATSSNF
jgi:hypothetical protein